MIRVDTPGHEGTPAREVLPNPSPVTAVLAAVTSGFAVIAGLIGLAALVGGDAAEGCGFLALCIGMVLITALILLSRRTVSSRAPAQSISAALIPQNTWRATTYAILAAAGTIGSLGALLLILGTGSSAAGSTVRGAAPLLVCLVVTSLALYRLWRARRRTGYPAVDDGGLRWATPEGKTGHVGGAELAGMVCQLTGSGELRMRDSAQQATPLRVNLLDYGPNIRSVLAVVVPYIESRGGRVVAGR